LEIAINRRTVRPIRGPCEPEKAISHQMNRIEREFLRLRKSRFAWGLSDGGGVSFLMA